MFRKIIAAILLGTLAGSFCPVTSVADEMMDNGKKYVAETWKNVEQHAKYMAVVDLRQAMSSVLSQAHLAGMSSPDQEAIVNSLLELEAQAGSVGVQAKPIFLELLNQLSDVTRRKFALSWQIMDWDTYRGRAKEEILRIIAEYDRECQRGHIEPGMTFQNTSPEIPDMSYSFSATYSTGGGSGAQFDATSGKGESKETSERRQYIGAAVTTAWNIHPLAGAIATVVGAAIELYMTTEEQNSIKERAADAAAYVADNRARVADIVSSYRNQCAALGASLKSISEIVSSEGEKAAEFLKVAHSKEFQQEYVQWQNEMRSLQEASCRSNLAKKASTMGCPGEEVPVPSAPSYVDDPVCAQAGSGCIRIASYSDSFCRTAKNGTIFDLNRGCQLNLSEYAGGKVAEADLELIKKAKESTSNMKAFLDAQKKAGRMAGLALLINLENSELFKHQYRELELRADNARQAALERIRELVKLVSTDEILSLMNKEILLNKEFEKLRSRYVELTARTIRALIGEGDRRKLALDIKGLSEDANAFFKRTGWFYYQTSFESGLQHLMGALR